MTKKIGKDPRLLFVLFAGFFLFHPVTAFVDVFPDCLGYLLLCAGLSRFADLNGHISEALRRFRILFLIGIGQLVAMYFVYGTMRGQASQMNQYEQPVTILLCSFVVLCLQWYFLIPTWREMLAGFDTLAERYGAEKLAVEKKGKTPAERLKKLSSCFVVVSSLMSVLPEATVLTSFENDVGNTLFPFDWYDYILLFRVFAFAVALIVGIIWLVSYLKFFGSAMRDRVWIERLNEAYSAEVLPQVGMLKVRRFSAVFFMLQIGILFTVNLRLENRAALPGIVFAALVWLGLSYLGEAVPSRKFCYAACGGLALCNLAQLLVNASYLNQHLPEASLYQTDAYWHYLAVRVLDGAEAVLTLVLVGTLLRTLFELVKTHTVVDYGTPESASISLAATERLHGEFATRMKVIFVFFALAAAVNIADAILRLEYQWIWLISFVLSFVGIWLFYSMLHELRVQIQLRYQSDGVNKKL